MQTHADPITGEMLPGSKDERIAALERDLAAAQADVRDHIELCLAANKLVDEARAERDTLKGELRNLGDRYEERVAERDAFSRAIDTLNGQLLKAHSEAAALRVRLKNADADADMYAKAWQRELGSWMGRNRHHIDACVIGTRNLRAAAEDYTKPHDLEAYGLPHLKDEK